MINFSLRKDELNCELKKRDCGVDLYFFEETSSTFDEAAMIKPKAPSLIAARRQTKGRGRLGRVWQSDEGGIYLSLILKPCVPKEKLQLMTAICAVGISRAIEGYTPCQIKWPNDIVSPDGKKLCGILIKLSTGETNSAINVGIGINANNESFADELKYASSIYKITGKRLNENALTASTVSEILKICQSTDLSLILEEYRKRLINLGKRVKLIYPNGNEESGLCTGADNMGALIVKKDSGEELCLNSGEVSVRGVYGEYA